ncbi:MAG: restriction endonuclease [Candidatus Zixiibacteriota bacterium]
MYDSTVRSMWGIQAGGKLRSIKGTLVVTLGEEMVKLAWEKIGGKTSRIKFITTKHPISDGEGNVYKFSQDRQVYIDGQFVLSIECKAYAEVAMYKRILVDAFLLQKVYPNLKFCLFQFESMLGGDYSTAANHPDGSASVKVLESNFPNLDIEIITLLDGERDIKREIHKRQFYKPLREERLAYALKYFEDTLKAYL